MTKMNYHVGVFFLVVIVFLSTAPVVFVNGQKCIKCKNVVEQARKITASTYPVKIPNEESILQLSISPNQIPDENVVKLLDEHFSEWQGKCLDHQNEDIVRKLEEIICELAMHEAEKTNPEAISVWKSSDECRDWMRSQQIIGDGFWTLVDHGCTKKIDGIKVPLPGTLCSSENVCKILGKCKLPMSVLSSALTPDDPLLDMTSCTKNTKPHKEWKMHVRAAVQQAANILEELARESGNYEVPSKLKKILVDAKMCKQFFTKATFEELLKGESLSDDTWEAIRVSFSSDEWREADEEKKKRNKRIWSRIDENVHEEILHSNAGGQYARLYAYEKGKEGHDSQTQLCGMCSMIADYYAQGIGEPSTVFPPWKSDMLGRSKPQKLSKYQRKLIDEAKFAPCEQFMYEGESFADEVRLYERSSTSDTMMYSPMPLRLSKTSSTTSTISPIREMHDSKDRVSPGGHDLATLYESESFDDDNTYESDGDLDTVVSQNNVLIKTFRDVVNLYQEMDETFKALQTIPHVDRKVGRPQEPKKYGKQSDLESDRTNGSQLNRFRRRKEASNKMGASVLQPNSDSNVSEGKVEEEEEEERSLRIETKDEHLPMTPVLLFRLLVETIAMRDIIFDNEADAQERISMCKASVVNALHPAFSTLSTVIMSPRYEGGVDTTTSQVEDWRARVLMLCRDVGCCPTMNRNARENDLTLVTANRRPRKPSLLERNFYDESDDESDFEEEELHDGINREERLMDRASVEKRENVLRYLTESATRHFHAEDPKHKPDA